MGKKRAMSSDQAREVRRRGHEDAKAFAIQLGIGKEFASDPQAKKDVIDFQGLSYSVKSGIKKWQIFLYGRRRFEINTEFSGTEFGKIFLECIDVFPPSFEEYKSNKEKIKSRLQEPIRKLSKKLQNKNDLKFFLSKSLFNNNEVDFLVVKDGEYFHIFEREDVLDALAKNLEVETSKKRREGQYDDQKVVFKFEGKTIGEIEMRTDSEIHYREVKFWLHKRLSLELLKKHIEERAPYENIKVCLYANPKKSREGEKRVSALEKHLASIAK